MPVSDAPAQDEVEISVFGRGFGEAILIHLGSDNWVAIDSLSAPNGRAAALNYLDEIGVSPKLIKLILATHWHDDHVRHISQIYGAATDAKFATSSAMRTDEWRAFQRSARTKGTERFTSGVSELDQIARLRKECDRPAFMFTALNRAIFRVPGSELAHGCDVSVESLSPSDEDVTAFFESISAFDFDAGVLRVEPFKRNDVSVATWIRIGENRLLLGADLEVSGTNRGWDAVLGSPATLDGSASAFKIAHHGSRNGDHPNVWREIVTDDPIAVLTTWNRGRKLPSQQDVDRILSHTTKAYSASRIDAKPSERPAVVEKTLREHGIKVRSRPREVGQVRLRMKPAEAGAAWRVDLFHGAIPLRAIF